MCPGKVIALQKSKRESEESLDMDDGTSID